MTWPHEIIPGQWLAGFVVSLMVLIVIMVPYPEPVSVTIVGCDQLIPVVEPYAVSIWIGMHVGTVAERYGYPGHNTVNIYTPGFTWIYPSGSPFSTITFDGHGDVTEWSIETQTGIGWP